MSRFGTGRGRSPRTPPLVGLVTIAVVALTMAVSSAVATAQSAKEKPEQTHVSPLGDPFQHEAEPAFAFHVPKKKKFNAIRERWRIVDLTARRDAAMKSVEEAIAGESAKETPDQDQIYKLETRKAEIVRFYRDTQFLLEVEGDATEFVRVTVRQLEGKPTLEQINPKANLEKNWKKVKVLQDKETTSKAMKKKGRMTHSLMLYGTPQDSEEHGWWRIESMVIPPKKGGNPFLLQYVRRMDASEFTKKTAKGDETLFRCLIVP